MSRQFDDHFFSSGESAIETDEWWPIPNYINYSVCRSGFIMSGDRLLKPHKGDKYGHLNVRLSKNGKVKEEYIHRLVAKRFIPNPNNYPIVRHLDDDPYNNNVNNLAWGTVKDNIHDCIRSGNNYRLTDEDREIGFRKSRRPIRVKNLTNGEEKDYISIIEASRSLGVVQANIIKVLRGERRMAGGYSFSYLDKEGRE